MKKSQLLAFLMAGTGLAGPHLAGTAIAQSTTNVGQINVEAPQEAPGAGYIIQEDSPKERSTVTKAAIEQQMSTANPFQLLSRLPGVNAQSTDATGLFGGSFTVRGFNSDEMGFTVGGVPVNDSGSYTIFPAEYVDNENLQEIDLTQGAPDIDQPQGGAVGGAVSIIPEEPTDAFRVKVVQSGGQLNFFKSFVRLDSGHIADTGFKAFVSYSKSEADKFKGPGMANFDHVDAGAVLETEQGSKFSFTSIYNDQLTNFYRNLTLAQYAQYGYTLDYEPVLPVFPANVRGTAQNQGAANGQLSAYPGQTYSPSNYYNYAINPFKNWIASLNADIKVRDNLRIDIQPYYWNGYGSGGGISTVSESATNTAVNGYGSAFGPFPQLRGPAPYPTQDLNGDGDKLDTVAFYRPSITSTQRPGINSKLTYQPVEWDTIRFGVNFDHSRHHQTQPYAFLNPDGTVVNYFADGQTQLLTRADGTFVQGRDQLTDNDTTIAFFENSATAFNEKLKIITGIKRSEVSRSGHEYLPVVVASGNPAFISPSADYVNYLPELQVSYRVTPEAQVFANLQKNARVPSNFTLYENVLSQIGAQKAETAWDLDIGARYQTPEFLASMSLYAINFQNRLLSFNLPNDPTTTADINAGSVHNRGVEFEAGTAKPLYGFNLYASATYNKSIMQTNMGTQNPITGVVSFVPTQGKIFPNAPKWLFSAVIEYLPDFVPGGYISVSPKYTGRRQTTMVNDESIPGYATVDLTAGYHIPEGMLGSLHNSIVQFTVSNLFDENYLFISNSNGSSVRVNSKNIVSNGVTFSGSAPSYALGAPRFFSVKLQTEF